MIAGDGTAVMQEAERECEPTDGMMPARKPALYARKMLYVSRKAIFGLGNRCLWRG